MVRANEYQELAARTINQDLSKSDLVNHALFGMQSEIGELSGLYQKLYQGHELNRIHAVKEVGDLLWFISEYLTAIDYDLEEVMQMNIDKLIARYPDGFESDKSLHRAEGDI